jgi:hypothetical protein
VVAPASGSESRTGRPGMNFSDSGFGVVDVWMNIDRFWIDDDGSVLMLLLMFMPVDVGLAIIGEVLLVVVEYEHLSNDDADEDDAKGSTTLFFDCCDCCCLSNSLTQPLLPLLLLLLLQTIRLMDVNIIPLILFVYGCNIDSC